MTHDLISKSALIEAMQSSIYVDHKYGNWIYEDALLNLINSAPVVNSIEHNAPSAPIEVQKSEERAWLVEAVRNNRIVYLNLYGWTWDSLDALRFAREQDCFLVISNLKALMPEQIKGVTGVKASEHIWSSAPIEVQLSVTGKDNGTDNKNSTEYFYCSDCNYKFVAEICRTVKCRNCGKHESVKSMRDIRALIPSTQAKESEG